MGSSALIPIQKLDKRWEKRMIYDEKEGERRGERDREGEREREICKYQICINCGIGLHVLPHAVHWHMTNKTHGPKNLSWLTYWA